MLLEFSVQNYRSFYHQASFNMYARSIKEHRDHVLEVSRQRILKTSALYGANASGKSNLFKSLAFMKDMVLNSFKQSQAGEDILVQPFLLNSYGVSQPTRMEIILLIDDVFYRYGFACTAKRVEKEWLYSRSTKPRSREIRLFERYSAKEYRSHPSFKEGKDSLQHFLRENTLLLSLLAQFNGEISSQIIQHLMHTNIWNIDSYMPLHTSLLVQRGLVSPNWVNDFLLKADMGITGFQIKEEEVSLDTLKILPLAIKQDSNKLINFLISTVHEYYDEESQKLKSIFFDLGTQESEGTKQFFSLAGLIYHSLEQGGRLLIDELEKSLHPLLCKIIIRLFQDPQTNPKGAQLVFTTHNTMFLDKNLFRRDELWFAEKDDSSSTSLYSLSDYKLSKGKARNDSSYGKDYIRGKYGAIPFSSFDDFARLFRSK